MGMFDYVDFECDCPSCGEKVTGFQSKDGPRELRTLKPWYVNNFYTSCSKCKRWVEYVAGERNRDMIWEILDALPEPEGWRDRFYMAK
jgi:hypothetical protein